MKLAGVVVIYNPTEDINDCIKTYIDHIERLYIIDNSKVDNSDLILKNKKIKYIPNYKNLGIAKALNMGANLAYEDGFDFLLTMDQDSKFKGDNLVKLIDYSKKCDANKVGIISPWHKTKENKEAPKKAVEEVLEVMTSGNIVNLKLWKRIKGWKEYFFIDNVDIEYCMNLNKHGYKVIRYNKSFLEHSLGNITKRKLLWKTVYCSNHNYIRQYYMIRNLFYLEELYKNDYPDNIKKMKRGALGRFKNILVFEKDKYRKIRNMYRGYRDYKKSIKGKYPYTN